MLSVLCGEGGIRTPGAFQLNSFQDCRNRPLYHLSSIVFPAEVFSERECKDSKNIVPAKSLTVFFVFF